MSTMTTIPAALVIEPGPTGAELPPVLDTERELLDAVMAHPAGEIAAALAATGTADLPTLLAHLAPPPQRIQLRRVKGWRKPAHAVSVARPTRWGNPFRLVDGDRARAVEQFRLHALGVPPFTIERIRAELAGLDLACWCPAGEPCHADVLLEIANSGDPS